MWKLATAVVLAATGCFSPSFEDGAVACGEFDQCPSGLRCSGDRCVAAEGFDPDAGRNTSTDAAEPGDAQPTNSIHVQAAVAECSSPLMPSPILCKQSAGAPDQMVVDLNDSALMIGFNAYLRFDVGDLDGRAVKDVMFVLTATDDAKAEGPSAGELWELEPFDSTALLISVPRQAGNAPIAPDAGEVTEDQPVSWTVPSSLVSANTSVHLGVFALDSDGVNFYNNAGNEPPLLVINLE